MIAACPRRVRSGCGQRGEPIQLTRQTHGVQIVIGAGKLPGVFARALASLRRDPVPARHPRAKAGASKVHQAAGLVMPDRFMQRQVAGDNRTPHAHRLQQFQLSTKRIGQVGMHRRQLQERDEMR